MSSTMNTKESSLLIGERFGDYLIRKKVVRESELEEALSYSSEKKLRLGESLVMLGYSSSKKMLQALAGYFELPWIDFIEPEDMDGEITRILGGQSELLKMKIIPLHLSVSSRLMGLNEEDSIGNIIIAIGDPSRMDTMNRIHYRLGGETTITFVVADEASIGSVLAPDESSSNVVSEKGVNRIQVGKLSPEQFMDNLLMFALSRNCTDMHIEKLRRNEGLLVRTRINGALEKYSVVPSYSSSAYEELVAYIKVKAGMAPDQKLIPQDGGWRWQARDNPVSIRVASIPTVFRYEKVSLRMLDASDNVSLETLGLTQSLIDRIDVAMSKTTGLILATGPTGSGKTTTLHAALSRVDASRRKIYTVEDPVEYVLPSATQIQVNPAQGLTFAKALRSIMRHDPDIVFVGEIRDEETALIALQFAMTGHLVLASMHTNDAIGAASRLVSLGAPSYMVASSISLSIGQRLVRVNCPKCAREISPTRLEKEVLKIPDSWVCMESIGCSSCGNTGISGRTSIVESIDFSSYPDFERIMSVKGWERNIWQTELSSGKTFSMYRNAMNLLERGVVSPANVMMTVRPGEFD